MSRPIQYCRGKIIECQGEHFELYCASNRCPRGPLSVKPFVRHLFEGYCAMCRKRWCPDCVLPAIRGHNYWFIDPSKLIAIHKEGDNYVDVTQCYDCHGKVVPSAPMIAYTGQTGEIYECRNCHSRLRLNVAEIAGICHQCKNVWCHQCAYSAYEKNFKEADPEIFSKENSGERSSNGTDSQIPPNGNSGGGSSQRDMSIHSVLN